MPAIEVVGLKKAYGSIQAVDGISFDVQQGEVFSLIGPNAAGKTTTIEILEGLRESDEGRTTVLGMNPWKDGYELHKRIGVMPQGFKFLDYPTPREAIRYYATLFGRKVDAKEMLSRVILEDAADVYFSRLSGGQKQKVGLALALVSDPQVVFLDEPTTGLDPQARRAIWEVIRNLKRENRTVLLTTHYLEEAEELADKVAILNHGKLISSGTPEEIVAKHGSGDRLTVKADESLARYLSETLKLKVSYGKGVVSVQLEQSNDPFIVMGAIQESGLRWSNLVTQRDSLEDIFVRMVGKPLSEEGGARAGS